MRDRAVVFIDGNNWYHGLGTVGVRDRARLDYKKICAKLLGPREWIATRYYIGQVNQKHNAPLYAQQRSFSPAWKVLMRAFQFTSGGLSNALHRMTRRTSSGTTSVTCRSESTRRSFQS
jgi:hypothetical protein